MNRREFAAVSLASFLAAGCACNCPPQPPPPPPPPQPTLTIEVFEAPSNTEVTPGYGALKIVVGGGAKFKLKVTGGDGPISIDAEGVPPSWGRPSVDAGGRQFEYRGKMPMGTSGDYAMRFVARSGGLKSEPLTVIVPTEAYRQDTRELTDCAEPDDCKRLRLHRTFVDEFGKKPEVKISVWAVQVHPQDILKCSYNAGAAVDSLKLQAVGDGQPTDEREVTMPLAKWTGGISNLNMDISIRESGVPQPRDVEIKRVRITIP